MAQRPILKLAPRTVLGKEVKRLRSAGIIPIHLYGPGVESLALQCDQKQLVKALVQAGMNTPISVFIDGAEGEQLAFTRGIQWDPVRGALLHVDLLHVDATREVTAAVPLELVGESPGARAIRGTVVQQLRELEVRALPLDMPAQLTVDLSRLTDANEVIRASDVALPANVVLVTGPDETVARVEALREEEAPAEAPAEEAAPAPEEEQKDQAP